MLKHIVIGSCYPNVISDNRKFSLQKRNHIISRIIMLGTPCSCTEFLSDF